MKLSDVHGKKILISCLNWGMGHVSRCIGLIKKLELQKNTIVIAGNREQILVFQNYFPAIKTIKHPDYPFEFNENESFTRSLWKQKWKLYQFLKSEKKIVKSILNQESFDLIISDHRYGFRSTDCYSIFLTHQVHLPLNGVSRLFQFMHIYWLKKFNAIWIVDSSDYKLAGKLSNPIKTQNFEFIGLLSRFETNSFQKNLNRHEKKYSVLMLSGPNIHVHVLFNYYLKKSVEYEHRIIIGSESALSKLNVGEINCKSMISNDWKQIDNLLKKADLIVSFYGYSTLMDAQFLNAKFELIPCPNQLEQEYLCEYHSIN
jgi:spore coat polysaccharide biosynthesis predicted glycosyltransferase SpsG